MSETRSPKDAGVAGSELARPALLYLDDWIPYQFSYISNQVSLYLEHIYSSRYGLTVTGWRVMAVLAIHQPLSAKEVSSHTAMDQVQVTRAINHLSSLGMISRRVDSADRRKIALRLSQRGNEVYSTVAPYANDIERRLLAGFTESEIDELRRLTNKMVAAAQEVFTD